MLFMMHLIGKNRDMNFINNFFGFLYRYYSLGKGECYGFYSTIFTLTALIDLNFLFVQDLLLFQIVDRRGLLFNFPKEEKFIVPTLIILACFCYFKPRFQAISKQYNSYSIQKKNIIRIWSLLYIIISVFSAIFMLYSVRNNIRWW